MIHILSIEVESLTSLGTFRGDLKLSPGLNVLSAANAYGKSLAMTAIPWCLGLEAIFGLQNNDPARFPVAVRDAIPVHRANEATVISSFARLRLRRDDGATLALTRPIKGANPEIVEVSEEGPIPRESRLHARKHTMADETGGLQHFLFQWMGLPHSKLMTIKGNEAELYLENLAPLFFVDQNEGWTDLQALQVYRYQIQEVAEAAVEYLLGARGALEARRRRQQRASTDARLKAEAEALAEQAVEFFRRHGWELKWSTHGTPADIQKRWSARSLGLVAREEFRMDPNAERARLDAKIASLRSETAQPPLGAMESGPSAQASQRVVELKSKRHSLRLDVRNARLQLSDHQGLLETTEHRIASSADVLRLKSQGIGRLDRVECPTCHRNLDPLTFSLTEQSTASVQAHIDSLRKQRLALVKNIELLESQLMSLDHDLAIVDRELQRADRALEAVNQVVGTARERFSKLASDLAEATAERVELESFVTALADLERKVTRWLDDSRTSIDEAPQETDLVQRVDVFAAALRVQLVALGFSALNRQNAKQIVLDERYVPYLGSRRLRSLGSASDHARLVGAYVLALGDASRANAGPHPGFIILDEPLQQNPDTKHRELMVEFFKQASASTQGQVIVTTSLESDELLELRRARVNVHALPGKKFLKPVPQPDQEKLAGD